MAGRAASEKRRRRPGSEEERNRSMGALLNRAFSPRPAPGFNRYAPPVSSRHRHPASAPRSASTGAPPFDRCLRPMPTTDIRAPPRTTTRLHRGALSDRPRRDAFLRASIRAAGTRRPTLEKAAPRRASEAPRPRDPTPPRRPRRPPRRDPFLRASIRAAGTRRRLPKKRLPAAPRRRPGRRPDSTTTPSATAAARPLPPRVDSRCRNSTTKSRKRSPPRLGGDPADDARTPREETKGEETKPTPDGRTRRRDHPRRTPGNPGGRGGENDGEHPRRLVVPPPRRRGTHPVGAARTTRRLGSVRRSPSRAPGPGRRGPRPAPDRGRERWDHAGPGAGKPA